MKAVLLSRHGGPDVLRITDVPLPEPKRGEVRVKIAFAGINFAEVLSRRGVYGWAPPLPYILGMEASGVVDAIDDDVRGVTIGDAVVVGTQFGTYAESICVPAERAFPSPQGFSPREAAAFPVNYLTAWIGLMEMARLRASDTVLITSAAGGVGTAAVQIAAKLGARVIGVASRRKHDLVRSLGAAVAIDYDDELPSADVVLDMTGGPTYRNAVKAIKPMGRIVIAGASGAFPRSRNVFARIAALRKLPRPSVFDMLLRSYGVMCFHVGRLLDAHAIGPRWRDLVRFTEEHGIRPVIGDELPFERIGDAHRALEERRNVGKVIVNIAS